MAGAFGEGTYITPPGSLLIPPTNTIIGGFAAGAIMGENAGHALDVSIGSSFTETGLGGKERM
jgi:hypothetical protein